MIAASTQFETRRQRYERLRSELEQERASFDSHWSELGTYFLPSRPRFETSDHNRGERQNQSIIDSTGTQAANALRSGMMGANTSPARPWKRLTTPDPDLAEVDPVKYWLHAVDQRMDTVFSRSNLYDSLQELYLDLAVFGTAAMFIEEDAESVIHTTSLPIGSYAIANDYRRRVTVCVRKLRMTVRQVVDEFAVKDSRGNVTNWENFSQFVRDQWQQNRRETSVDVCHVVAPNDAYDPDRLAARHKKYASCYYEIGISSASESNYMASEWEAEKYLRESGYDYFPVIVLRWSLSGGDVYATDCPGMTALGDVKQLQLMEKRGAQALEKSIFPALNVPTELRNAPVSILPGGKNYVPSHQGAQGIRPVHEVKPPLGDLEAKEEQIRRRIESAFFADLFRMFARIERQMTATEVAERQSEKLLALGPVLERLNRDGLKPLIDITFDIMLRQGMIPEAPEELEGVELKVEYVSIMAQAQKAVGLTSLERAASFVASIAEVDPEILDMINRDEFVEEYVEQIGIPPRILRSKEAAAEIRARRAQAQQAQMAAEQAKQVTGAVKDLSQSTLEGDSALSRLLKMAQAGNVVPAA